MKENYLEIKVGIPTDGQKEYAFAETHSYNGNNGSGGAGVTSKEDLLKHFEKLIGVVQFTHNSLCVEYDKCPRCLSSTNPEDHFCSKCGLQLNQRGRV